MEGIVVQKWEGREQRISCLGLEVILTEGELFDKLYKEYDFQRYIDSILSKDEKEYYDLSGGSREKYEKWLLQLKEDIKTSKPQITIRIELEKEI